VSWSCVEARENAFFRSITVSLAGRDTVRCCLPLIHIHRVDLEALLGYLDARFRFRLRIV
jgi:hypothetical protein